MIKKIGKIIYHTSSGGYILHKGKILMIKNFYHGGVVPPHGHVEKGESNLDAAKREICEETGYCDLQVILKLGKAEYQYMSEKTKNIKTEYRWLFELRTEQRKPKLNNKESGQLQNRWYTINGAIRAASFENSKTDLQAIKQYLARLHHKRKAEK
ncbi:MAG: NUDIX domain-containing protein [Patescibacteria group bacterium]|jgi:8-oxo-dGTP pyrophosphatase MutT (NUDIX family)